MEQSMPESCPAFPDGHHDLLKRTVKIVVSHISNNKIPVQDMGKLIKSVYDALNGAHSVEHEQEPQKKPAVPVNRSVFPEYIICLEDGVRRKMLKRYLRTFHGMTVDEYRKRWGLPQHYPMVAPNYAIRRSSIARQAGLGQTVMHDSTDRTGPDN